METCKVPGCDKPVKIKSRRLCSAHYSQLRRTGSPTGSLKQPETVIQDGFIPKETLLKCSVEGCENPHLSGGFCNKHYLQNRNGTLDKALEREYRVEHNLCAKCGINERSVSPTTGEYYSWCRSCLNESSRNWNASEAGPRWRRYKLKKQDIVEMKMAQGNACAICGDSFDEVKDHVDHDNRCCGKEKVHNGGTCGGCVRDLLCGSCNQGLGNFKDDPVRLAAAIEYLRKWE